MSPSVSAHLSPGAAAARELLQARDTEYLPALAGLLSQLPVDDLATVGFFTQPTPHVCDARVGAWEIVVLDHPGQDRSRVRGLGSSGVC